MGRYKEIGDYVAELDDQDWKVRRRALKALGRLGRAAWLAVPEVERLLADPVWQVRGRAAVSLADIGVSAAEHVSAISFLLDDAYKTVRNDATLALGLIGSPASSEVQDIMQAARSGRVNRATAFEALGAIGQASWPFRDELLEATQDSNFTVRFTATRALNRIFGSAPELRQPTRDAEPIPEVLGEEQLRSSVAAERARAVESLAVHNPKVIASSIEKLLLDKSPVVRRAARGAIEKIGSAAVRYLLTALSASTHDCRALEVFATSLGTVGPPASPAVPVLSQLLAHPNAMVVRSAATALAKIGDSAKDAILALLACLSDPRVSVRRSAMSALVELGPIPGELLHQMRGMFDDEDRYVRERAQEYDSLYPAL